MGTVVTFPEARRFVGDDHPNGEQAESATIIILPVVRIERYTDEPSDGLSEGSPSSPGRKRRRRTSRS